MFTVNKLKISGFKSFAHPTELSIEDGILKQRLSSSKKYDIKATPTIYINNEKYDGDLTFEALKLKIDSLLN